jgi:hypothetical protein
LLLLKHRFRKLKRELIGLDSRESLKPSSKTTRIRLMLSLKRVNSVQMLYLSWMLRKILVKLL